MTHSFLRAFALAALAAATLLDPSAARGEDPEKVADPKQAGYQFFEERAKSVLVSAGDKVWEAADEARKAGFHQFAIEQAERAVGFNPNHKEAREYLKYAKKGDKWVQDTAAFEAMPHQNQRASGGGRGGQSVQESEESFQKRIKQWEDEVLRKANEFVADRYAALGEACAQKGFAEQAKRGYEAALRLDPQNSKARKGLGYKKLGKIWITDKQEKAMQDAAKGAVVEEKETSRWEDFFEVKMNKVESAHFRIESPYTVDELMTYVKAAETAYAYYLADFGRDPAEDIWGRRGSFVVMDREDQWNKYVDAYGGSDKEYRELVRQCSGHGSHLDAGVRSGPGSTVESRRDQIVHKAIHWMNETVWRVGEKAWLDEGLAYYYTLKVLESCLTHCVSLRKGKYANQGKEGGLKDWGDVNNWKPLIKELVQAKNDLPLRTLIFQRITVLEFHATVKSWCVVTWLMEEDRDRFMVLLDRLTDHTAKQDSVFEELYGKGLEDIDDDWHRFVIRTY